MPNRLVVVSNRVPPPPVEGAPWLAGGLVSALLPALEAADRALWFGWSGCEGDPHAPPTRVTARGVEYVTVDLSAEQVHGYYEEFCNRALWPALHGMLDRIADDAAASRGVYAEVNRRFGQALAPLLEPDDVVWVQDYHLIPLGAELRRLGWRGRVGYFHHTPVPAAAAWERMPDGAALASMFASYDLVGVQTERDARRLRSIVREPDVARRIAAYPISIEPERFRAFAACAGDEAPTEDGRLLFFGVDRLDYTKGIPQRIEAFGHALEAEPRMRDGACLVQWAAPSRTAIPEYQDERAAIETAAQHVQERFGAASLEVGYDSQPPAAVAAALARADVCVVTSVADGMNLVAKEFAAVHSADRPGVLVLSDSCGAAEELTDALIFPAGDVEAMSAALRRAYDMPEEERRERSARLRAVVDGRTAGDWLEEFVGDLESIEPRARPAAAAVVRADGDGEDEALRDRVEQRLGEFERDRTIERLWTHDYTLWKPEPDEITDRLGWLEVDRVMGRHVEDLRQFAADAGREGYTTVVLIGMGGSSLAPRVFASAFAGEAQGQRLIVLDSTVPAAVRSVEERVDPGRTLFIASSKSGATLETRALLDYFWERHPEGRHWVAITDAGSPLHTIGEERSFRRVFLNPADIGGRYSALSFVGLVPAALLGIDLERLLASAASMREACGTGVEARVNPGARLGAMLAEAALMGRDYLAVDAGPELAGFPAWLEQLIAESTGKDGGGILPLVGEAAAARHVDGPYARTYTVDARAIDTLTGSSYPVHAALRGDPYALGAEYFRWEFGVAVAGRVLGINPFDQPDVEAAKAATRLVLDAGLPAGEAAAPQDVLAHVGAEDYLALHAYLARDAEADARLTRARARLSERFGLPVTLEYGPSLLHSTGQYHKGGPRRGHFIQILDQETPPLEIPGRAYDFGELKNAQAEGDRRALEDLGLAVGRCTLDGIEEAL